MEIRTLAFKYLVGIFLLLTIPFNSTQVQASEAEPPKLIIDDIKCTGNSTTDCDFITKKYYQKVGDVLNPDEIEDAKLRLGTLIQSCHTMKRELLIKKLKQYKGNITHVAKS
ncbi:hypothetical protein CJF42_09775 [Pseudoalteromonas sp. NBT06-2]|uniref:hypothetical protein n=1 Tax=Pseudoalteromonas sp. NBT06-2 TaxID=2025950 RepID=UPI000BA56E43|nr:hypothetical protein [Pseudoalteromonas sp. NBT06-2]PAJ74599.1 hypothetical protein CJF42_09775 [Pseudoalteromonas sp. NBT06-2]